jgi:hypothetical protein
MAGLYEVAMNPRVRAILMQKRLTRGLLLWSLLTAALACNAILPRGLVAATPSDSANASDNSGGRGSCRAAIFKRAPARQAPRPPASWIRPLELLVGATPTAPELDPGFHVDMHKSVAYLASDDLEGRMIGTPGIDHAADYIATVFSKLGLQSLPGLDGYFQHFDLVTRTDPDPQKSSLKIAGKTLKLNDDFLPLRMSAQTSATGQVVFAGYGIEDAKQKYNDYAHLDIKGKIVLLMRFEPHDATGKSRFAENDDWSVDATIAQKVRLASDHGAAGIILVNPPLHHDDEGLIPFTRRDGLSSPVPLVQITVGTANDLLKQGGAPDLKTLQSQIDQEQKPHSIELKDVSADISFAIQQTHKQVENVAAILPGKGAHADEYIVIGAHYDHLGHGGPGSLALWSHGIHHGADDNASGTTAMMELADRFAHAGPQSRTLVFIAFTAEEEGLLGSQHFVSHSPIVLEKVAAMLNLDMVGRVSDEKLLIGGKGTAPNFAQLIADADAGLPLKLGEFGKGGIGPSDHTSFALKKIPVLFFFSGLHLDYHRPTDTADKINYDGMDQVVDLGERVVKALATMPRQKYNGSFDASGLAQMAGPATGPSNPSGARASMGAIPDYAQGEDAKGGMRIGGIMPGSPAEKAGLRQGDLVTRFNADKIENMMDYTNALAGARPGQTARLSVVRDGKKMELEATLSTRKD